MNRFSFVIFEGIKAKMTFFEVKIKWIKDYNIPDYARYIVFMYVY